MYLQKEYPKITKEYNGIELYPITRAGRKQMDFPLVVTQ